MDKTIFRTGASFALLAVILGAFAAHSLKPLISAARLEVWHTGVSYQMYHALAILLLAFMSRARPSRLRLSFYLFTAGICLFSGSLYLLVLLSVWHLSPGNAGLLTPVGGLCFIAGWISLLGSKFES